MRNRVRSHMAGVGSLPKQCKCGMSQEVISGPTKKTHDTACCRRRQFAVGTQTLPTFFPPRYELILFGLFLYRKPKKHFLVFNFCQGAAGGLQDFFWAFRLSLFHLLLLFCVNPKSLRFAFLFLKKRWDRFHTLGVRNLSPRIPVKLGGKSLHVLVSRNARPKRQFAASILGEVLHFDFYFQFIYFWWTKSMSWRVFETPFSTRSEQFVAIDPGLDQHILAQNSEIILWRGTMRQQHHSGCLSNSTIHFRKTRKQNQLCYPCFNFFSLATEGIILLGVVPSFPEKKLYVCCHQKLCLVKGIFKY